MEHKKKGRKLGRTTSHKKALLSNLSVSLIKNKRIKTTEAKAKELRTFFEPLVTKAKEAYRFKDSSPERNVHLRRIAKKSLKDKEAIKILFDEIGPKIGDRPGGYTRVLKTGFRVGDGASLAIIELVDYSFIKEKEESTAGKKKSKGKVNKKVEEKPDKGEKVSEEKVDEDEIEPAEKIEKEVITEKDNKVAKEKTPKKIKTIKGERVKEKGVKKRNKKEEEKTDKKDVKKTNATSTKKDVKKEVEKQKTIKSNKSDTSSKEKK